MALYDLKSSGAAFRAKIAGVIHDLLHVPSKAYPDVWIRPAVRPDGSEYYEMALCYVDDVLVITAEPMKIMDGIRAVFKLKGDKVKKPDMYLGASLSDLETADGKNCWTMSSEKYVKAAIENVEARLDKSDLRLSSRCDTPMSTSPSHRSSTSSESHIWIPKTGTQAKVVFYRLQIFDWEDLYKDAREPTPLDMPETRGLSM